MLIKAEQKYTRFSPRKVRLVADTMRGLSIEHAVEQLSLVDQKSSMVLMKVLRQAVANATNNLGLSVQDLEIDQILIGTGPRFRRFRAVSRGRGHEIKKPTCHVKIVLKTKGADAPVKLTKKAKKAEPKKVSQNMALPVQESAKPVVAVSKIDRNMGQKATQSTARRITNRTTSK